MTLDQEQQARRALDRAQLAMSAGQYESAQRHLAQCLQFNPQRSEARLLQARLALHSRRPGDALAALDAHDMYFPQKRDDPTVSCLRAQALAGDGKNESALKILNQLAQAYPDDVRAHRLIADVALQCERPALAVEHLKQVARLCPLDGSVRGLLSRLLAATDKDAAAQLLSDDPVDAVDPAVRLQAARLYHAQGRLRDAVEAYGSLLADCDDDAQLWYEAGLVADEIGDSEAAAARLERALELSRGDASQMMAVLARVYMHAGRMRRATMSWIKLARRGPSSTSAWAGALVCALGMGHRSLAERASRVLNVHTSRSERRQLLAELWRHAVVGQQINRIADGDYEYKATQHSPVRSLLARAAQTLEAHGMEHPNRADTHYHHAVCLNGLGKYDQAEDSLVKALEINPQYGNALQLAQAQAIHLRAA